MNALTDPSELNDRKQSYRIESAPFSLDKLTGHAKIESASGRIPPRAPRTRRRMYLLMYDRIEVEIGMKSDTGIGNESKRGRGRDKARSADTPLTRAAPVPDEYMDPPRAGARNLVLRCALMAPARDFRIRRHVCSSRGASDGGAGKTTSGPKAGPKFDHDSSNS
ncbi:hypothetical protein EVAR_77775_1 [Eumeta japonica]|uniref:Uncharacterized protein n=1 Tax=Eumeta variegata TaxID=151549 RepID=A0A4C1TEC9_EUMVA|nr:hypothetical protein EVAR_77775_1 [Eumeta japonica]